jgi:uncharacterized membrane protein YjfL (UPF0719 family)
MINFKITQTWYEILLITLTATMYITYIYIYISSRKNYGEKYIPLIITARTLVLAGFLIFFYNPLRSTFEYGHSLPLFAFGAGISLLLFLDKYQILNLVHFLLYGDTLPERPKKVCRLENDTSAEVDIGNIGSPEKKTDK